MLKMRSEVELS
jgi:Virulence-associated protein E